MADAQKIPKPLLEDTRLVIVVGASFPSFRPPNPPFIQPIPAPKGEENKEGQWFHVIPSPPPKEGFPHAKHFRVAHQVMVGTVDEIVARFRKQLEAAFHQLHQTKDLPEDASPDQKEDQATMWAATADMQNILGPAFANVPPGDAVCLPFIDAAHPAFKDWQNAKQVNSIRVKREQAKAFNLGLLSLLKGEDTEKRKQAIDDLHTYIEVLVHDAKLKLASSGVEWISTDPVHLKMWGLDIKEEDFHKEVDLRDQLRGKLNIGQATKAPVNPADLYLIDVDTE